MNPLFAENLEQWLHGTEPTSSRQLRREIEPKIANNLPQATKTKSPGFLSRSIRQMSNGRKIFYSTSFLRNKINWIISQKATSLLAATIVVFLSQPGLANVNTSLEGLNEASLTINDTKCTTPVCYVECSRCTEDSNMQNICPVEISREAYSAYVVEELSVETAGNIATLITSVRDAKETGNLSALTQVNNDLDASISKGLDELDTQRKIKKVVKIDRN